MASTAPLRANSTADADPRYAWVMLPLATMMQIGTSPGQTFGVSLFNDPIRQELALSHTALSGAYLVASLLAAVPLMFIGRRMDRHGLKIVSLLLVTMVGVACLVVASATDLLMLTLGFFLLRAFGQGGLSMAAGNTLGMWFNRRLGIASGMAGVGMAAAIAVTPLAYHELIETLGWRMAYVAIGLATWCVLLPTLVLLYRNNLAATHESTLQAVAASGQPQWTLASAMRTPCYWIAAGCVSTTGLVCTAVFFHLVPLFESQGLTAAHAAGIFPTVAIAMATMQATGGLLADRLPLGGLVATAMTSLGAGVAVLSMVETVALAHLGAALMGCGQGLLAVTGNTLWPRYFGRLHLGAIRSSVWTATVAACSIGPFIMGGTFDLVGSFLPAMWLMTTLALAVAIAAAVFVRPPRPEPAVGELLYKTSPTLRSDDEQAARAAINPASV